MGKLCRFPLFKSLRIAARTKFIENQEPNGCDAKTYARRWSDLWQECQDWLGGRPPELLPVKTTRYSHQSPPSSSPSLRSSFPVIFYSFPAAISSNQLYHTACILLIDGKPPKVSLDDEQPNSQLWHARRICGISLTNPHRGCLNNAIQPLWVAGKLLSHRSEHVIVVRLIERIEAMTGWGTTWRIKDLREAWGYDPNEPL